jgi:multidrug transporter EmrE-like cation transporter
MAYVLLFAAIALEVVGSLALKESEGLTRPWLGALMFVAFAASLALLTHVSTKLPLSLTYPTWAALGTTGAVTGAILVFGETLTAQQVAGIAVIIAGVVILHGPSLMAQP